MNDERTTVSDVRAIVDVNWQVNIFIESDKKDFAAVLEMYYNCGKPLGKTVVDSGWFRLFHP